MKMMLLALFGLLGASAVWAQEGPQPGAGSAIAQFLFLGGFVLIFYLLVWRPQSKRAKEHRELVGGLGKGDEIVAAGGLAGRITRVKDDFLVVEVADGVEVKIQKNAVTTALPKGTLKDI